MESNPMLVEVWRLKDQSAREASEDIHRLSCNTRQRVAGHLHTDPVVRRGKELWRLPGEVAGLRLGKEVIVESCNA